MASKEPDLYAVLGVSRAATETEIRRKYRNLITKEHPDKGGDADRFAAIQRAYDVLSNEPKRKQYDTTGVLERSADEELVEAFGGGKFRDRTRAAEEERQTLTEAIILRQSEKEQSHGAGFETWLRSRGDLKIYTGDDVAEEFGVNKSSYEPVILPSIRAYQVRCNALGAPSESVEVVTEPIPKELEWGEVLVNIRAMPVSPGDLYNIKMGATPYTPDGEGLKPPFVAGNDGLAVVVKVGPGVKFLSENDWVIPNKPAMGTWQSLVTWKEKDVIKIPTDLLPIEYAAMLREMCVAYRLLEDHGQIMKGDSVILNAANSAVGTCVIQLCRMLKLRAIAVIRARDSQEFEKTAARLKALGASEVLQEGGSLKAKLDEHKYFAKPRLALDAVGGASAVALADTLADGCPLVIYGCMSGKAPQFTWPQWTLRGLQVQGFNLRKWMAANKAKIPAMLQLIANLVNADQLRIDYTEYELCEEFKEALEHAQEDARNTKILLKVNDIGVTY